MINGLAFGMGEVGELEFQVLEVHRFPFFASQTKHTQKHKKQYNIYSQNILKPILTDSARCNESVGERITQNGFKTRKL